MLASSWRITVAHEERWRVLRDAKRPHVFLLWHEALLPLLWQHRNQGVAIVVSEARDGQYLVGSRGLAGVPHRPRVEHPGWRPRPAGRRARASGGRRGRLYP